MKRWEQRFRLSCPDFANRFQSGLQNVIVHLRPTPNPKEIYLVEYVKETSSLPVLSGTITHNMAGDIQKQPVLIKVVELMQETKSFITAAVGLYTLDEFYGVRMDQMFYSLQSGFGTGSALREREVNRSEDILRCIRRVGHDELIGEVVEGSNEIADNISSGTQGIEGDMKGMDKARRVIAGLDLTLSATDITVKPVQGYFHVSQVLFGPLDL